VGLRSLTESFTVLVDESAGLDVLLGIVPSTTGVGHGDGELDTRQDGSWEDTGNDLRVEDDSHNDWGEDDEATWGNHFSDRSLSGDTDTSLVVWLELTVSDSKVKDILPFVLELSSDLSDHLVGSSTDGFHGKGREEVWKHGTYEHGTEDPTIVDLD
jgi:hypothetical protein